VILNIDFFTESLFPSLQPGHVPEGAQFEGPGVRRRRHRRLGPFRPGPDPTATPTSSGSRCPSFGHRKWSRSRPRMGRGKL